MDANVTLRSSTVRSKGFTFGGHLQQEFALVSQPPQKWPQLREIRGQRHLRQRLYLARVLRDVVASFYTVPNKINFPRPKVGLQRSRFCFCV